MIVVKIKWDGEPEQMVGPFGQIGETLRWITEFRETLFLNQPSAHATLTTHIIHDPVTAMTWTATGVDAFADDDDESCDNLEESNHPSDVIVPERLR